MKMKFTAFARIILFLAGVIYLLQIILRCTVRVDVKDVLSGRMTELTSLHIQGVRYAVYEWYETGFDYCVAVEEIAGDDSRRCAILDADHPRIDKISWTVSGDLISAHVDGGSEICKINLLEKILSDSTGRALGWRSGSVFQFKP